jgi:hypothetical protein
MALARVHLELAEHLSAERVLGQHSAHGVLDDTLRQLILLISEPNALQPTLVARIAEIVLVPPFIAGDANLVRINHDDIVAGINVGCVFRLVLAAQASSYLGGYPTEDFVGSIDDIPLALDRAVLRDEGFHSKTAALTKAAHGTESSQQHQVQGAA